MGMMRLGAISRIFLTSAALVLGAVAPAAALTFTPLVQEFSGSGPGSKQVFRVGNEGDGPIAVQVEIKGRHVATDGRETLSDADQEFLIFPPQMVLKAGEERLVRVQWLGDPAPTRQLGYRIIAEQLPVNFDNEQPASNQLRILVRYEGSIYISPPGAESRLGVTATARTGAGGERQVFLVFANTGTAYQVMRNLELTLTSTVDATTVTLTLEQLKGVSGQNVQAGRERHFAIAWPAGLTAGPLDATMRTGTRR